MRSKAFDPNGVQPQKEVDAMDLYQNILEVGCFTCSNYAHTDEEECIDICHDSRVSISPNEWQSLFSDTDPSRYHGCEHALKVVFDLETQAPSSFF